jgi:hypothetical protein
MSPYLIAFQSLGLYYVAFQHARNDADTVPPSVTTITINPAAHNLVYRLSLLRHFKFWRGSEGPWRIAFQQLCACRCLRIGVEPNMNHSIAFARQDFLK